VTIPRKQEEAKVAQEKLIERITAIFRMAREENFESPLHVRATNAEGTVVIEMTAYNEGVSGFRLIENRPPRTRMLKLPITILLSDNGGARVIKLKIGRTDGCIDGTTPGS
jgi:hypothetical protein